LKYEYCVEIYIDVEACWDRDLYWNTYIDTCWDIDIYILKYGYKYILRHRLYWNTYMDTCWDTDIYWNTNTDTFWDSDMKLYYT